MSKPSASPTPNATFRAIRIYSSDDSWGEGPQWSPPGNPFVAADFPHVGSRVEVSFGTVPDEVRDQLDEVEALRGAVLQKLFMKTEMSIADLMAKATAKRSFEDPWHVTLTFDQPTSIPESIATSSDRVWLDEGAEAARDRFRSEARQALDVVAAHVATIIGPGFLARRIDEKDVIVLLGPDMPLSIIPAFSGSASASVSKGAEGFPAADLRKRLAALDRKAWNDHRWLQRSMQWFTTSLTTDDPWRSFQTTWLALEVLVHKAGQRYRQAVLGRLATGSSQSVDATTVIAGPDDRASLTARFAIVALELSPDTVDEDLPKFRRAKESRDGISHGTIDDPDDLPTADVRDLARRYINLVLRRVAAEPT